MGDVRNAELRCMAAYGAWHLWNERNRRIFQQKEINPSMLLQLIIDDYGLLKEAKEL
ncbi:hypothetical protein BRADI_4g41948v3 [Brachypodium distachyon]|uniref:Uncharacterized protein n=1 Tax=Brachypodium distachyon TaxID=15368 RepID=A0A0Q3HFA8_BRADI|nr:hypothetical protein BRADI_4g41948v3 [Brachypodium distachyon]